MHSIHSDALFCIFSAHKNVSGKRCSVDAQAKVILGYFQGPGFRTSNANERVGLAEREGGVE